MKVEKKDIDALQSKMGEIDQFSPLFADKPDEDMFTSVKGEVTEFTWKDRKLMSLELVAKDDPDRTLRVPLVSGAEHKKVWNIGIFTALRDYQSASGKPYVAGETKRIFAY